MRPSWSAASIRVRLTGWYTVVLFLMLVVYATATFVAVRHEFFEQFDDQLQDDFKSAERALTPTSDGRMSAGDRYRDPDSAEDRGTDVWSPTGETIYRSSASAVLPTIAHTAAIPSARYESVVGNGRRWRTLTGPSMIGGRAVLLRASRSEEHLRTQLWEILVVLVLGLPLVVVLAGGGGYVLAGRALAPIDHLASEARRITADRLHERLSVPNQQDEIGRLAAVINETFARLESSFDRLRRFTADASHELRTPLAVIRGIGEVGLGEPRSPSEYKDAMGSMLEEVDRLTNLVDTLLRLSHGDAGTVRLSREPIDLGQLTNEAVSSLSILAEERNQRLRVYVSDPVIVTVDRLVLREAITNIVDNAIKYAPSESTIDIRVQEKGNQVFLTIADEGPGIAAEHRERIFDRFFRLDEGRSRDSGGTGLGLAIAKWAVEANGGQIVVEPRPTGGSVFRIVLPLGRSDSNRRISGNSTPIHERTAMKRLFIASTALSLSLGSVAWAQDIPAEYQQVLTALGRQGDYKERVLKVNIPRNDVSVTVANVKTPTPFGFGGWVAMTKGTGGMDVMMGDLVLTQDEVNPVMSALLDNSIDVPALHNHFLWDEPRMSFMHVHGHGTPADLARKVKPALDLIGRGAGRSTTAPPAPPAAVPAASPLDRARLAQIVGTQGEQTGAVYKITIGRDDLKVLEMGAPINARMGLNTWAAFVGTNENSAVAGDVAMLASEVTPVLKALRNNGLDVVAIHHHMTDTRPTIFFLHDWRTGPVDRLATGFKAALDELGKTKTALRLSHEGGSGYASIKMVAGSSILLPWCGRGHRRDRDDHLRHGDDPGKAPEGFVYYVTRCHALEDNCTIYHVVNGRRQAFQNHNGKVASGVWHTLRVEAKGDHFLVTYDGTKVLDAKDVTFKEAGKVGVWTKADSVIAFDDLSIAGR